MVRFTRVVVQLPTQLVSNKWQKHISTICGNRAEKKTDGSNIIFSVNGADLKTLHVGEMQSRVFSLHLVCNVFMWFMCLKDSYLAV